MGNLAETVERQIFCSLPVSSATSQNHNRSLLAIFDFLEKIKDKYEVIVFTASQQVYANELLNIIDPRTYILNIVCILLFRYVLFELDSPPLLAVCYRERMPLSPRL